MITFNNSNTRKQFFSISSEINNNFNTRLSILGYFNSNILYGSIKLEDGKGYGFKTINNKGVLYYNKLTKWIRQH